MTSKVGIAAIGCAIPSLGLTLTDLAEINGIDPQRYLEGLGCQRMALCGPHEDIASLAVAAAHEALEAWGRDLVEIGLVALGTESGEDYSKPLTQAVCRSLGLSGALRTYEVKHACLGGTLAIAQAIEWIRSGAANGKSALVIAVDVCTYERGSPSEPTQGCGAVAFVIGDPVVAEFSARTYSYSKPVNDFWRPVGSEYPSVEAGLSHRSYLSAVNATFSGWKGEQPDANLDGLAAMTFHCPFPKMVQKAFKRVADDFGLDALTGNRLFEDKVDPYLGWNRYIGNAYTASLWISVARALAYLPTDGAISSFSYGSGCGAELLFLTRCGDTHPYWAEKMEERLNNVELLSKKDYLSMRQ